ncbi:arylsulfatase [Muricauda sp. 2012CJ35-5]|uniref:Arylsulfatase n=1 Tax=Flagellimonas spongiicola TaxID=2942208 RepID=A0ABT0PUF2_9FLAO|nr:arylsulfatase [Allomuricauda spongiicola]MCL6274836.1 arylsulfatase [Allomuricauda spongiicola]
MHLRTKIAVLAALCCGISLFSQSEKPNIIYFLADDLGYGEVGAYGQEIIKTPNIDSLVERGMKFTQHYSGAPVCAPARYILMTGKHAGHAYIRGNDEWRERGEVWDYKKAFSNPNLEGQRPIPENTITIAKKLKEAGYTTGVFGKWGLGAPNTEGVPNKQGFDYFFGYNCQRQAHNLFPSHLWENENKVYLKNELIAPHERLDSSLNPLDEKSYDKFYQPEYAPDVIHEKALTFMEHNKDSSFFLYYASPLPHLPLQIPKKYAKPYLDIIGNEEPYIGDQGYFPNPYPKASYAAMITLLDQHLGELIQKLKDLGIYENTLILFTSDNGPTYTGGVDFEHFESSKPFTNGAGKTKGHVYEGGIRVPFVASWPQKIKEGSTSAHQSVFYDVMPTLCEVAGIEAPNEIDGISFLPELLGKKQPEHDYLYWEFPSYKGQQAVRIGDWKGIRKNIFEGNLKIELYNLKTDIEEQNDLAQQHPEIVERIEDIMKREHVPAANERFKFRELGDP